MQFRNLQSTIGVVVLGVRRTKCSRVVVRHRDWLVSRRQTLSLDPDLLDWIRILLLFGLNFYF